MGKKGRWFSALKRAFSSTSKGSADEHLQKNDLTSLERQYLKEKKKWGIGRSRDGEHNSFISLYREPSSIEKILVDAEREQQHWIRQAPPKRGIPHIKRLIPPNIEVPPKHESPLKQEKAPKNELLSKNEQSTNHRNPLQNREFFHTREALLPNKDVHPRIEELAQKKEALPKTVKQLKRHKRRPPVSLKDAQISATKIQAAYRGYKARKSYHSLKGLIRLQGLLRGESVKHQTMNAMRCMQLLVRVQSQIRSRRTQRIENRNHQHNQAISKIDMENDIGRWNLATQTEAEVHDHWDDSMLTKEERDSRMQKKLEAIMKRERALAYAYQHQLLKVTPKTASAMLTDIRSGGYPMWWSWLERTVGPKHSATASVAPTPSKPTTTISSNTFRHTRNQSIESSTSRPSFSKPASHSRIPSNRWAVKPPARDDDSLTSCPPFTAVPGYMAPTVSARAKVREATPPPASADVRRRFTSALGQSLSSLRWTGSRPKELEKRGKHRPTGSVGTLSMDSTWSLPVGFAGRRPFK